MYYKLIRQPSDGLAVRGRLFRVSHYFNHRTGLMTERLHPICNTLENARFLVPALIYRVHVTQSAKFKRLLPVLDNVPGRSGIRFHRGTRPEHSRGCILVSAADEQGLTARWLAEQQSREETRLEISNYTNLNLED